MARPLQIAIDGPVGAGKSTIAKILAEKLGITYIYTGAMYRAVALAVKQKGVDWSDKEKVEAMVDRIKIDMFKPRAKEQRLVTVVLEGKDVTDQVFSGNLGEGGSVVSQYTKVREVLVRRQRELARDRAVVMEGRDIGTNVLPKAQLKIYLDADVDERIRRKQAQLQVGYERVKLDIFTRDKREMGRENNPLRPAKDAWVLDTSEMTIEQVVEKILARVKQLMIYLM
ncbi:cytidylate kinase [Microgenomates group bacterium RBG_16_45_19]|nr:MAG: cytidylate kinase [Microgenomates group bacterium RBG_16_45_19]